MEFKARYQLIGAFTLAVIAMGFGFIYWLNNGGAQGRQAVYKVQFEQPVSGLQIGGGVFFNGIRVGEISGLELDPKFPARLSAVISIKEETPVREDTVVGINHQALTGLSDITLTGRGLDTPLLIATSGQPGVLVASARTGASMAQSIDHVLLQIEEILGENKKPLNEILANLATFSKSLGGNKERVENILNGLERMTGGSGKAGAKVIYDLMPPTEFAAPATPPTWRLVINEPSVLLALNTDKIQQRPGKGQTMPLGIARWSDNLPNLIQEKIIQSFENAGYANAVLRPIEGEDTDNKLLLNIRGFHLDTSKQPTARVELMAKLQNGEGKVLASRLIKVNMPAQKVEGAEAANALGKAFSQSVTELINWSAGLL